MGRTEFPARTNKHLVQALSILLMFAGQPAPTRALTVLSRHNLLVLSTVPQETSPLTLDGQGTRVQHGHGAFVSQRWDLGRPDLILGCLTPDKSSLPSAERSPRQEAVGRGCWASDPVLPCMTLGYFQISNEKPFGRNAGQTLGVMSVQPIRNSNF